MKPIFFALALLSLGACQRSEDAMRGRLQPWIGRPLRDLAVDMSVVPQRLDARTYILVDQRALGACRRSVTVDEAGLIVEISTASGC